jgi:hypothetical protein
MIRSHETIKASGMRQLGLSKAERRAVILISLPLAIGVVAFSVWSRSYFGIIAYGIFVAIPSIFSLLRSRKPGDSEVLDKMMEVKDDPKEMARFVP